MATETQFAIELQQSSSSGKYAKLKKKTQNNKYAQSRSRKDVLYAMDSIRGEDAEERDEAVEAGKKFLDLFGVVIPYLYATFAVIILALLITGISVKDLKDTMFWSLLGAWLIISLFGAWAVFKYGIIQDQIDRLKEENEKYKHEIGELKTTRIRLGTEVNELTETVTELESDAEELEAEAKQFEHLLIDLKKIAGDNEDILALVTNTNKVFDDMKKVVLENERAHLLSKFYECAFRDDDNNMDKREYKRFLGHLSKRQREKFTNLGTFEELAGDDNVIDLEEFQDMLEDVLAEVDELIKEEFAHQ